MTLDPHRRDTLLKTLRGREFRRAIKAIAELRAASEPGLAEVVREYRARDEQREVQFRIARVVLERGVRGLVDEWTALGTAEHRASLISEIGHFFADESTIDLILTALEDSEHRVRTQAVWVILGIVRSIPERERRAARAESNRRAIAALDMLRESMTAAHRSRATRTLVAMLRDHPHGTYPVLPQIVEVLGYTASADDDDAIPALEALRSGSGEPTRVSYERLDETKLEWYERLVAERKGVALDRIKLRITYTGTGLLDRELLESSLRRIRARG